MGQKLCSCFSPKKKVNEVKPNKDARVPTPPKYSEAELKKMQSSLQFAVTPKPEDLMADYVPSTKTKQ